MTSFFHDLEEQLRTAAHQRASGSGAPAPTPPPRGPNRRVRAWLAGGARAVPVLVAVAVTLTVLVGALVLLGHRGGQAPTPPASGGPENAFAALVEKTPKAQLQRELALIGAATRKVQALPVCRVAQPRTTPQINGRPGQGLLSTLGVLRRRATATDRLPAQSIADMDAGMAIYAGAARRAAQIGGTSYYLVPIRQNPASDFPSAQCFARQSAALSRALPTMPPKLRAPARTLQAALIAYDTRLAAMAPIDGVCEVTVHNNGGGMSCSETAEEIRRGVFPEDDNGVFSGVVPDGVASVKLSFPGRSAIALVHGNFYAVSMGGSQQATPPSPTVTWRAADGRVLRTYTNPGLRSFKQACREHPEACVPAFAIAGSGQGMSASSSSSSATAPAAPSPRPKRSGG